MARALIAIVLFSFWTLASAQENAGSVITVKGEVMKPLKLTTKDLAKFPQTEVKARTAKAMSTYSWELFCLLCLTLLA